jgi:hypothetical protein
MQQGRFDRNKAAKFMSALKIGYFAKFPLSTKFELSQALVSMLRFTDFGSVTVIRHTVYHLTLTRQ